jgi:hypothetical protein
MTEASYVPLTNSQLSNNENRAFTCCLMGNFSRMPVLCRKAMNADFGSLFSAFPLHIGDVD